MRFVWMYAQDVVGAPVVMAAFGAGCMSSSLCVLAVVKWFVPWYERASRLVPSTSVAPVSSTWESGVQHRHQVVAMNDVPDSLACLWIRDLDANSTPIGYLTVDEARSLVNWLTQQLKGVPQ